jgi:hypothetical protein
MVLLLRVASRLLKTGKVNLTCESFQSPSKQTLLLTAFNTTHHVPLVLTGTLICLGIPVKGQQMRFPAELPGKTQPWIVFYLQPQRTSHGTRTRNTYALNVVTLPVGLERHLTACFNHHSRAPSTVRFFRSSSLSRYRCFTPGFGTCRNRPTSG